MIDTKALRSKILDLAIRGLLTQQLPEDGTAEELYEQIQDEKEKLIQKGKLKKEKPLPEISEDEIPFEIPESWKWARLGSTGITITGGTPAKSHPEFYGGNYPFFKPSDLDAGRHITVASEYLTEKGKNASRQLLKGSILVCCIGSIGKCAIIDTDGTVNQQINALTPLICNSDYLLYAISSEFFNYQLNQGSRATTVSIINKSKFDNCLLPLPPLAEQKRIVDIVQRAFSFLDEIDALQAQYADNCKALKSKLIDAAIQGKLTDQLPEDGTAEELYRQIQEEKQKLIKEGKLKKEKPLPEITNDEIPFEIPENWKWCRIGDVFTLKAGKNIATGIIQQSINSDHQYPCYGGNGLRGFVPQFNVDGYHAIIGRQGALCGNINFAEGKFYATEHAVVVYEYAKTDMTWAGFVLRILNLNQYATSVAQPGLSVAKVNHVLLPLPPLAEQKRIVAKLDELLPLLEK